MTVFPRRVRSMRGCLDRSKFATLFALIAIMFVLGCGDDAPPPPAPQVEAASLRTLGLGQVIGFRSDAGAHVWRGLPLARPPLGALRWRAPEPPLPWSGVRESLAFGDRCVQFAGPLGARDGLEEADVWGREDCLYLNVFAPPFTPDSVPGEGSRLPVMVWIHGGGNSVGDAHPFDASKLAVTENVIVVSIHYRLGVLGWFAHDALHGDDASLDDRSGNYGTLDTVRALAWVREHIAAFGGDPSRVTIFGESAGGSDVFALLVSPRAAGLFHGAIVQSGSGDTEPMARAQNDVDASPPGDPNSSAEILYAQIIAAGRASDRAAAKQVVATMSNAEIASFLRGRSPEELLAPFAGGGFGGMYGSPRLLRDGHVLPLVDVREALAAGRFNAVPTIFGTNRDESKLFMAFSSPHIARLGMLPLWFKNERMYDLGAEYSSNVWKAKGADEAAQAMAESGRSRAWVYRFDWDEEAKVWWVDLARLFGAAHALELPFVFGTLNLGDASPYVFPDESREGAQQLADRMMGYWGRFAHTGDPMGESTEESPPANWPAWKAGAGRYLIFDSVADGGLQLSDPSQTLTRKSVLAAVASDFRFESDAERCEIYGQLSAFSGELSEAEYRTIEGGLCKDMPLPQ